MIYVVAAAVIVAYLLYRVYLYNKRTDPVPGDGFEPPLDPKPITEWQEEQYFRFCTEQQDDDELYTSRGIICDYSYDSPVHFDTKVGKTVVVARDRYFRIDFHPEWKEQGREPDIHSIREIKVFYRRTESGYILDPVTGEGLPKGTGCDIVWVLRDGKYYFRYIFPDGVTDGTRYTSNYV